jgi:hypothetical protein
MTKTATACSTGRALTHPDAAAAPRCAKAACSSSAHQRGGGQAAMSPCTRGGVPKRSARHGGCRFGQSEAASARCIARAGGCQRRSRAEVDVGPRGGVGRCLAAGMPDGQARRPPEGAWARRGRSRHAPGSAVGSASARVRGLVAAAGATRPGAPWARRPPEGAWAWRSRWRHAPGSAALAAFTRVLSLIGSRFAEQPIPSQGR